MSGKLEERNLYNLDGVLGGPDTATSEKVTGSEEVVLPMKPSTDANSTAHVDVSSAAVRPNDLFHDGDPIYNCLEQSIVEELRQDDLPDPVCYQPDLEQEVFVPEKCDTRSMTKRGDVNIIRPKGIPITKSGQSYTRTLPVRCDIRINDTQSTPVKALLDTGASLSIISRQEFEKSFKKEILESNNSTSIKGLGKDRSHGTFITTIFIESTEGKFIELDVEFHVLDDFDAVCCVGNEVMSSYGINTLMTENKAHIPSIDAMFNIEHI